jgi:hypothetical protein
MVGLGIEATYTVTSDIDPARLLADSKGRAIAPDGVPLKLRLLADASAWRAVWADPEGNERYRLVRAAGGAVHLIDLAHRTRRLVDKLPTRKQTGRVEISRHEARHPKLGPLNRVAAHISFSESATAVATIDAFVQGRIACPPLAELWAGLAPWLGNDAVDLGLPVAMRIELLGDVEGVASMRLDSLRAADISHDAFDIPAGLKEIGSQSRRLRMKQPGAAPPALGEGAPARPRSLFTGMGPETVKVIADQMLVDAIFSDVRAATSYISGFSGTRFVLPTSDWFTQIVQSAPVPTDGQVPSVIPGLMVRVFLAQVCAALHALNLSAPVPDPSALAAALPADQTMLKAFLTAVATHGALRPLFASLLERIVPGLGPSSPRSGDEPCVGLILSDLESSVPFGSDSFVRLAEAWYGLLLPSINLRPIYKTRQEIEDAVAVFHPSGEVTIDELADLVDINLNDFEHSITFGNRPLFAQPAYLDTTALRLIGQALPWFRQLQNIRFGFLTELVLAGAAVSCNIDITPALTPATAVLGFFCPPCVLSLFMTGSASASIEDAHFPLFLYLEQDPLHLDAPRWRTVFAEPQISDVDANIFLIGFNVILALILDVIGNTAGGFILNEVLKSFGTGLGDAVDGILAKAPLLDAGTMARLGRDPDRIFPPNEQSLVAYEAPPRAAGGYQFETFRQAVQGTGTALEFPAAGGTLDTALALVLGPQRASKLSMDVAWPSYFGPFETRKPDGTVSDIDWWAEAPDQTGMPPRPPHAQNGPPPGVLLIPQNVGQSWWTFNTIIDVEIVWLGWRDLADSPADEPVADVQVRAWCRGEAAETEIIMYEECQDVTRLAAGLADRWRVDPSGPAGPIGPVGPVDPVGPLAAGGPSGVMIAGAFLQRQGRPGAEPSEFGPGWADGTVTSYRFDPRTDMPRPDDPGSPPVPGTILCRDIVTLNTRQRETWMEASLQFSLPVLVGLTESLSYLQLEDFVFLPAIRSALGEHYPVPETVALNLFATGPLQTLNLPANSDWIRDQLVSIATDLAGRTGMGALGPFHYDYGIDFVPTLVPEQLQQPLLKLRLASVTTWPFGAPLKRVAFKWELQESLLGRA